MRLALNTFVYEVAQVPIEQTLHSASRFGFTYIEYAAYGFGDPTQMGKGQHKEVIQLFKDNGLQSSQLLLANTEHLASPDPEKRKMTLDYMKRCADFQLKLGGRQVLICWGCGVHEAQMMPEQAWLNTVSSIREYAEWALDKEILIDLELDPHVYFVVNNTVKMAQVIEDVGMPNVFPNVDIGHLCITREAPHRLDKLRDRILHVHLSETDTYEHTNSILGSGKVGQDKAFQGAATEIIGRIQQPGDKYLVLVAAHLKVQTVAWRQAIVSRGVEGQQDGPRPS